MVGKEGVLPKLVRQKTRMLKYLTRWFMRPLLSSRVCKQQSLVLWGFPSVV